MLISKRNLLKMGLASSAVGLLSGGSLSAFAAGVPRADNGISVAERRARILKAQQLMQQQGIEALIVEPGSTMDYFSGIQWRRSERLTALIIPKFGEVAVVTPFFEEPSVRESLKLGSDVRTWHEHVNPHTVVAGVLKDRGITSGKIAFEDTVRHFVVDGLAKVTSGFSQVSGAAVVNGCRMIKSPAELALMQKANDITMATYRSVYPNIKEGMTPSDIGTMMKRAMTGLGGKSPWTLILLGEASAYPHGSGKPQSVKENEIVLMDCGCAFGGYQADISRTFVYGKASDEHRKVWDLVKAGQEVVMDTAKIGVPAGHVDDAVRALYEKHGYGPDYQMPGLPHRTGHGIGMDGHEPANFVRGEKTLLAAGMCFSNEPGLYAFGKFGVRLEDCLTITANGPKSFTNLSPSIEKPFG